MGARGAADTGGGFKLAGKSRRSGLCNASAKPETPRIKKRKTRIFSLDLAGQWSYVHVISRGNQARLKRKIDR
jgi:hypothetical protein